MRKKSSFFQVTRIAGLITQMEVTIHPLQKVTNKTSEQKLGRTYLLIPFNTHMYLDVPASW